MAQIPVPPRPFSPPQSHPSPSAPALNATASFLPPTKRQRVSPNPTSPYATNSVSPMANTGSVPAFHQPGNGPQPQSHGAGSMGPPSRPADKPTDISALTDVLGQAGVDMKDEENALIADFSQSRQPQQRTFQSPYVSPFSPIVPGADPASAATGSPYQQAPSSTQATFGGFFGGGPLSGAPGLHRTPVEILKEEMQAANRRRAQEQSIHLSRPFLQTECLRRRIEQRTSEYQIRLQQAGVSDRPLHSTSRSIVAADGTTLTVATSKSLERDSPLVDILSLLSLATSHRIRGLVEDAAALAKGRRVGANGLVPPDWTDLAVGPAAEPATAVSMPSSRLGWDSSSAHGNPLKRSHAESNQLPTPASSSEATKPAPNTIVFPNKLARSLRTHGSSERSVEDARLCKRLRKASAPAESSSADAKSAPGTPGTPATGQGTGLPREVAPDVPEPKKMTKKELAKQKAARNDVARQQATANSTANMMLGNKKRYSWMMGGAGAAAVSSPGTPGRGNVASTSNSGIVGSSTPGRLTSAGGKRVGDWREDKERGAGIQIRDWVSILEADGREKKALAQAFKGLD